MVVTAYRKDDYPNADGFAVQAATLAETYPDEVIERVTNVITGIQTQSKFPPTLAEFKDFLEYEVVRVNRITDLSRGKVNFQRAFVPPSNEPGCRANLFVPVYAPHYAEMVKRSTNFDADVREFRLDPNRCGQDWKGKPERRGGIHVAVSWYRPDMATSLTPKRKG